MIWLKESKREIPEGVRVFALDELKCHFELRQGAFDSTELRQGYFLRVSVANVKYYMLASRRSVFKIKSWKPGVFAGRQCRWRF